MAVVSSEEISSFLKGSTISVVSDSLNTIIIGGQTITGLPRNPFAFRLSHNSNIWRAVKLLPPPGFFPPVDESADESETAAIQAHYESLWPPFEEHAAISSIIFRDQLIVFGGKMSSSSNNNNNVSGEVSMSNSMNPSASSKSNSRRLTIVSDSGSGGGGTKLRFNNNNNNNTDGGGVDWSASSSSAQNKNRRASSISGGATTTNRRASAVSGVTTTTAGIAGVHNGALVCPLNGWRVDSGPDKTIERLSRVQPLHEPSSSSSAKTSSGNQKNQNTQKNKIAAGQDLAGFVGSSAAFVTSKVEDFGLSSIPGEAISCLSACCDEDSGFAFLVCDFRVSPQDENEQHQHEEGGEDEEEEEEDDEFAMGSNDDSDSDSVSSLSDDDDDDIEILREKRRKRELKRIAQEKRREKRKQKQEQEEASSSSINDNNEAGNNSNKKQKKKKKKKEKIPKRNENLEPPPSGYCVHILDLRKRQCLTSEAPIGLPLEIMSPQAITSGCSIAYDGENRVLALHCRNDAEHLFLLPIPPALLSRDGDVVPASQNFAGVNPFGKDNNNNNNITNSVGVATPKTIYKDDVEKMLMSGEIDSKWLSVTLQDAPIADAGDSCICSSLISKCSSSKSLSQTMENYLATSGGGGGDNNIDGGGTNSRPETAPAAVAPGSSSNSNQQQQQQQSSASSSSNKNTKSSSSSSSKKKSNTSSSSSNKQKENKQERIPSTTISLHVVSNDSTLKYEFNAHLLVEEIYSKQQQNSSSSSSSLKKKYSSMSDNNDDGGDDLDESAGASASLQKSTSMAQEKIEAERKQKEVEKRKNLPRYLVGSGDEDNEEEEEENIIAPVKSSNNQFVEGIKQIDCDLFSGEEQNENNYDDDFDDDDDGDNGDNEQKNTNNNNKKKSQQQPFATSSPPPNIPSPPGWLTVLNDNRLLFFAAAIPSSSQHQQDSPLTDLKLLKVGEKSWVDFFSATYQPPPANFMASLTHLPKRLSPERTSGGGTSGSTAANSRPGTVGTISSSSYGSLGGTQQQQQNTVWRPEMPKVSVRGRNLDSGSGRQQQQYEVAPPPSGRKSPSSIYGSGATTTRRTGGRNPRNIGGGGTVTSRPNTAATSSGAMIPVSGGTAQQRPGTSSSASASLQQQQSLQQSQQPPHRNSMSRMMLRISPTEEKLITRSRVKTLLRGGNLPDEQLEELARNLTDRNAADVMLESGHEDPIRIDTSVEAQHPHTSTVAIEGNTLPVDVHVLASYSTNSDDTTIVAHWLDAQRLISVQLVQHIRVGEQRKKELNELQHAVKDQQRDIHRQRIELHSEKETLLDLAAELEERSNQVTLRERTLVSSERELEQEKAEHEARVEQFQQEQDAFEAEKRRQQEVEKEHERRRRTENERQRAHERQMESELRKQAILNDQLQRHAEQQKAAQLKLEKETEKINRERDQFKRDLTHLREREVTWMSEEKKLETQCHQLQHDLREKSDALALVHKQLKETQKNEKESREELETAVRIVEYFDGRLPSENDIQWQKRKENRRSNEELASQGIFPAKTSLSSGNPPYTVKTNTDRSVISHVRDGLHSTQLLPSVSTTSEQPIPIKSGSYIEIEVGEGFCLGDVIFVNPQFLVRGGGVSQQQQNKSSSGSFENSNIHNNNNATAVFTEGLPPLDSSINNAGTTSTSTSSRDEWFIVNAKGAKVAQCMFDVSRRNLDALRFTLTSTSSVEQANTTVETVLKSIMFHTPTSTFCGTRTLEVGIFIVSSRIMQPGGHCWMELDVVVIDPPLIAHKRITPFVERGDAVSILGHYKPQNPYSGWMSEGEQMKFAEQHFYFGTKGYNLAKLVDGVPSASVSTNNYHHQQQQSGIQFLTNSAFGNEQQQQQSDSNNAAATTTTSTAVSFLGDPYEDPEERKKLAEEDFFKDLAANDADELERQASISAVASGGAFSASASGGNASGSFRRVDSSSSVSSASGSSKNLLRAPAIDPSLRRLSPPSLEQYLSKSGPLAVRRCPTCCQMRRLPRFVIPGKDKDVVSQYAVKAAGTNSMQQHNSNTVKTSTGNAASVLANAIDQAAQMPEQWVGSTFVFTLEKEQEEDQLIVGTFGDIKRAIDSGDISCDIKKEKVKNNNNKQNNNQNNTNDSYDTVVGIIKMTLKVVTNRGIVMGMLQNLLHCCQFKSSASPLASAPRKITLEASVPNLIIPLRFTKVINLPILNAPYHVEVECKRTWWPYFFNSIGIPDAKFDPSPLFFASQLFVRDELGLKFEGRAQFKINSPALKRDQLRVAIDPTLEAQGFEIVIKANPNAALLMMQQQQQSTTSGSPFGSPRRSMSAASGSGDVVSFSNRTPDNNSNTTTHNTSTSTKRSASSPLNAAAGSFRKRDSVVAQDAVAALHLLQSAEKRKSTLSVASGGGTSPRSVRTSSFASRRRSKIVGRELESLFDNSGQIWVNGERIADYEVADLGCTVRYKFHRVTTVQLAQAVLRCICFETVDHNAGRRSVTITTALGRGNTQQTDININVRPGYLAIERIGCVKWVEGQPPTLATSQISLFDAKVTPQYLTIHVSISSGLEKGDLLEVRSNLRNARTTTIALPGKAGAPHVKLSGKNRNADVVSGFRLLDSVYFFKLNDHSLVFVFTKERDTSSHEKKSGSSKKHDTSSSSSSLQQQQKNSISSDGCLILGNRSTTSENETSTESNLTTTTTQNNEDSFWSVPTHPRPEKVAKILQNIVYIHTSKSPKNLKKVLRCRAEDKYGVFSDCYLPVNVVPIDDPTDVNNVAQRTLYIQNTYEAQRGLQIAPESVLDDPDTDDFVGGFLSVEPIGRVSVRDELYILPVAEQLRRRLDGIVSIDERNRIFVFADEQEYEDYKQGLAKATEAGMNAGDCVTQCCVGVMRRIKMADGNNTVVDKSQYVEGGDSLEGTTTGVVSAGGDINAAVVVDSPTNITSASASGGGGTNPSASSASAAGAGAGSSTSLGTTASGAALASNNQNTPAVTMSSGGEIVIPASAFVATKLEFCFTPAEARLIPLEDVQCVLRSIAFRNDSTRMSLHRRHYLIRLGAGVVNITSNSIEDAVAASNSGGNILLAASAVGGEEDTTTGDEDEHSEGAESDVKLKVADHTQVSLSLKVVPGIFHFPPVARHHRYIRNTPAIFPARACMVLPLSRHVDLSQATLVVRVAGEQEALHPPPAELPNPQLVSAALTLSKSLSMTKLDRSMFDKSATSAFETSANSSSTSPGSINPSSPLSSMNQYSAYISHLVNEEQSIQFAPSKSSGLELAGSKVVGFQGSRAIANLTTLTPTSLMFTFDSTMDSKHLQNIVRSISYTCVSTNTPQGDPHRVPNRSGLLCFDLYNALEYPRDPTYDEREDSDQDPDMREYPDPPPEQEEEIAARKQREREERRRKRHEEKKKKRDAAAAIVAKQQKAMEEAAKAADTVDEGDENENDNNNNEKENENEEEEIKDETEKSNDEKKENENEGEENEKEHEGENGEDENENEEEALTLTHKYGIPGISDNDEDSDSDDDEKEERPLRSNVYKYPAVFSTAIGVHILDPDQGKTITTNVRETAGTNPAASFSSASATTTHVSALVSAGVYVPVSIIVGASCGLEYPSDSFFLSMTFFAPNPPAEYIAKSNPSPIFRFAQISYHSCDPHIPRASHVILSPPSCLMVSLPQTHSGHLSIFEDPLLRCAKTDMRQNYRIAACHVEPEEISLVTEKAAKAQSAAAAGGSHHQHATSASGGGGGSNKEQQQTSSSSGGARLTKAEQDQLDEESAFARGVRSACPIRATTEAYSSSGGGGGESSRFGRTQSAANIMEANLGDGGGDNSDNTVASAAASGRRNSEGMMPIPQRAQDIMPIFSARGRGGRDGGQFVGGETRELRYRGYTVALFTPANKTGGLLRFDFLSCPASVILEILKRVHYVAGPKDKLRPGARVQVNLALKTLPGLLDTQMSSLTVLVSAPIVDDLPTTPIVFSGTDPAKPFQVIRVRNVAGFGGGSITADLEVDSRQMHKITNRDYINLDDANINNVANFMVKRQKGNVDAGEILMTSYQYPTPVVFGTFTLSPHSLHVALGPRSDRSFPPAELVMQFLRNCVVIGSSQEWSEKAPTSASALSKFLCNLAIEDGSGNTSNGHVTMQAALPKNYTKGAGPRAKRN